MSQEEEKIKNPPFWYEDPNIILNKHYILEFFPTNEMTFNQKLNAVTRLILFLTGIGFIMTRSIKVIIASFITLFAIYFLYKIKKDKKKNLEKTKEGFKDDPAIDFLLDKNGSINDPLTVFDNPTSSNPLSNVLVTDYEYNPEKKPAPPSYNENINNDILTQAKQFVIESHPDQPDIADKLFNDLGEEMVFEQSMRQFNSNPSTTIPNDQGGFADFLYGSMVSCKEGNAFACARNLARYKNSS